MTKFLTRTGWTLTALLSLIIATFSYRYFAGVGMSPDILKNLNARPWLWVHVAGAATALMLGPFQFLGGVRARWPVLHRWTGRTYVVACLTGAVGGFVMAFGSTAGPVASVGFATLAVVWFWVNLQGWRMAVARRFPEHRAWMIRSFALTFAAVTLRIYVPLLPLTGLSPLDGYRLTAYIAWIPNLILVELYLRGAFSGRRRRMTTRFAGE